MRPGRHAWTANPDIAAPSGVSKVQMNGYLIKRGVQYLNSIEDVYNRLQKNRVKDEVIITLSDDKALIEIKLSPVQYVLAGDDMVEVNSRKNYLSWSIGLRNIGILHHLKIYTKAC